MKYAIRHSAKPPRCWDESHEEVLHTADRLWDDLRALLIQCRREEELAEESTGDAGLLLARRESAVMQSELDAAFGARRKWRQQQRTRGSTPELERAIDEAVARRNAARKTLGTERKRIRRQILERLQAIWDVHRDQQSHLAAGRHRRYPELHWSICNDVLARFRTAAREAAKQGRIPRPAEQHRTRSLYFQLQAQSVGGAMVPDVRADGTKKKKRKNVGGRLVGWTWERLLARPRGVRLRRLGERSSRRASPAVYPVLVLTLPLDPELEIPILAHQVPPPGAILKGVRLVRTDHADATPDWHVVWSVEGELLRPIAPGQGTLYIGPNWRRTPQGLRVLDGVDGTTGERVQLHCPPELVARAQWSEAFQSALDHAAEEAAAEIGDIATDVLRRRDWSALRILTLDSGKPSLREWAEGTHQGHDLHVELVAARKRYPDDLPGRAAEIAMACGDRVGRRRLAGHRLRTRRQRRELYRQAARIACERYDRIVVVKLQGRRLAQLVDPVTGTETPLPLAARRARTIAAPSEAVEALRWVAQRAGVAWEERRAIDLSHTCPICGAEMERSPQDRARLWLRCDTHGSWNRDHALAMALWRDDLPPDDRERWLGHADEAQRSQVGIVRLEKAFYRKLRGPGEVLSRLRYTAGGPLAKRKNS